MNRAIYACVGIGWYGLAVAAVIRGTYDWLVVAGLVVLGTHALLNAICPNVDD